LEELKTRKSLARDLKGKDNRGKKKKRAKNAGCQSTPRGIPWN